MPFHDVNDFMKDGKHRSSSMIHVQDDSLQTSMIDDGLYSSAVSRDHHANHGHQDGHHGDHHAHHAVPAVTRADVGKMVSIFGDEMRIWGEGIDERRPVVWSSALVRSKHDNCTGKIESVAERIEGTVHLTNNEEFENPARAMLRPKDADEFANVPRDRLEVAWVARAHGALQYAALSTAGPQSWAALPCRDIGIGRRCCKA